MQVKAMTSPPTACTSYFLGDSHLSSLRKFSPLVSGFSRSPPRLAMSSDKRSRMFPFPGAGTVLLEFFRTRSRASFPRPGPSSSNPPPPDGKGFSRGLGFFYLRIPQSSPTETPLPLMRTLPRIYPRLFEKRIPSFVGWTEFLPDGHGRARDFPSFFPGVFSARMTGTFF